jgi:hypothetical protein
MAMALMAYVSKDAQECNTSGTKFGISWELMKKGHCRIWFWWHIPSDDILHFAH